MSPRFRNKNNKGDDMRFLGLVTLLFVIGCGSNQQTVQGYSMSWSCRTTYCYTHVSPNSWGGNGDFATESDCLAWETGFLNTAGYNGNGSVTACTAHY
jgi:hypothetical protein